MSDTDDLFLQAMRDDHEFATFVYSLPPATLLTEAWAAYVEMLEARVKAAEQKLAVARSLGVTEGGKPASKQLGGMVTTARAVDGTSSAGTDSKRQDGAPSHPRKKRSRKKRST